MAVSFAEARAIVDRAIRPIWPADGGAWYISPEGWEDDRGWWVIAGARECLVDDDLDFAIMDCPAWVVEKETGELAELNMLIDKARLFAMTPTAGT